jgi:hypothetical protein
MIIRWIDTAEPIADKYAEEYILNAYLSGTEELGVSTSCMLSAARWLHKDGKIKISAVIYDDKEIFINDDGKISIWPQGLGDTHDALIGELI